MAQAGGRKRKAGSDVPVRQLEVRDSMLVRAETSYNLPFDAVGGFAKNHTHVVFREALNNAGDFGITAANLKTTKLIVYYEEVRYNDKRLEPQTPVREGSNPGARTRRHQAALPKPY